MKIGVLGNCTAPGVGLGLQQLLWKDQVFAFETIAVRREGKVDQAIATLSGCEVLFTHPMPESFGELATNTLRERFPHLKIVHLPILVFTGLHPDSIYISGPAGAVASPLGPYNSAIIAAAHTLGASAKATEALFNADVFQQLGYFTEFAKAKTFADKSLESQGFDLSSRWPAWMARGPFMHTINHPKGFVVGDIAKLVAVNAGLVPADTPSRELVFDALSANASWPVYPEIARALGAFEGNYLFKKPGLPDLASGESIFFSLPEFIEKSLALYSACAREQFDLPVLDRTREVLRAHLPH